ncbi:MAG: glycerol uptake facilitator-like aquaporin [Moritella dasanensis]|jgi:glycerol uptake facilitator-like aquaporin
MPDSTTTNSKGVLFISLTCVFSLYLTVYPTFTIWLLFDGLTNKFSSLYFLWKIDPLIGFSTTVNLLFFTTMGAILGGAILNIISFHKYFSVEKNFNIEYLWGYFFTPILSAVVGIVAFSLVQGGLLVLNGSLADKPESINSALGFIAIGCIAGYNWDVFIRKLQELSSVLSQKTN